MFFGFIYMFFGFYYLIGYIRYLILLIWIRRFRSYIFNLFRLLNEKYFSLLFGGLRAINYIGLGNTAIVTNLIPLCNIE